jgi:N-acetylmuramoyl-L-alanine amidase
MRPKALAALAVAAAITAAGAVPALAADRTYDDFDTITSHVDLAPSQKLAVASPSGDYTTSSSAYYLSGTSNPNLELTCNGSPVEGRGVFGSWGWYAALDYGDNVFTFRQPDGSSQTVTITRTDPSSVVVTTSSITQMTPTYDKASRSGETVTLTCVAPSGASVHALVGDYTVRMEQTAATAVQGVPATFKGSFVVPSVSGTQNLGPIRYVLNDKGTYTSSGSFYAVGENDTLLVEVKETSVAVFDTATTTQNFTTIAKGGAVDYVTDQTDTRYQLGMGGWISKEGVTPLTASKPWQNQVSGVTFSRTQWGERYKFASSANVVCTTYMNSEKLSVEFHHTTGIGSIPTGDSQLFSGATVTQKEDSTLVEWYLEEGKSLWGYVVEYDDENGITTVYCKYPAQSYPSQTKPLTDIIVGLDAGHGGPDTGALGTAKLLGATESDINRATAIAVKKRLESLGATVILADAKAEKTTTTDRLGPSEAGKADFYISLHCNSISGNGLTPNGVEVYYYTAISKNLATALRDNMVAETGRKARNVLWSYYKVTLNTYCPSAMVEMGFMTNPRDYDDMCSKAGIFNTANAVADSILQVLGA